MRGRTTSSRSRTSYPSRLNSSASSCKRRGIAHTKDVSRTSSCRTTPSSRERSRPHAKPQWVRKRSWWRQPRASWLRGREGQRPPRQARPRLGLHSRPQKQRSAREASQRIGPLEAARGRPRRSRTPRRTSSRLHPSSLRARSAIGIAGFRSRSSRVCRMSTTSGAASISRPTEARPRSPGTARGRSRSIARLSMARGSTS